MTTSIIEGISVDSDMLILDDDHASYEDTSEVMDVIVESGTPLIIDARVHDTSDSMPELVESSVSNQISKYSFVTFLVEYESDHETVHLVGFLSPLVIMFL